MWLCVSMVTLFQGFCVVVMKCLAAPKLNEPVFSIRYNLTCEYSKDQTSLHIGTV